MGWIIALVVICIVANVLHLLFGELFEQLRYDSRTRRLKRSVNAAARRDRK